MCINLFFTLLMGRQYGMFDKSVLLDISSGLLSHGLSHGSLLHGTLAHYLTSMLPHGLSHGVLMVYHVGRSCTAHWHITRQRVCHIVASWVITWGTYGLSHGILMHGVLAHHVYE